MKKNIQKNNNSLVQVMVYWLTGGKSLSEPTMKHSQVSNKMHFSRQLNC